MWLLPSEGDCGDFTAISPQLQLYFEIRVVIQDLAASRRPSVRVSPQLAFRRKSDQSRRTLMKKHNSLQSDGRKFVGHANRPALSRRNFVKSAATVAAVAATVPLKPMLGGKASVAEAASTNTNASGSSNS